MVNIYKLKLTILQLEIIRLLFVKSDAILNQRRISQLLDVSQPAVMKSLPELKKLGFIKLIQDKESKRWAISLNRDNRKVLEFKRADNLKQIYESNLADYLESEFAGDTIILFGSYSRGEDTTNSDIDIAIIGSENKILNLNKYEKILERVINISFFKDFNKMNKHFKENLCNGIVLIGGIDL